MNLTEKIAYIKGLAEGLALDEKKPEVRVIKAIIDFLGDMAYDLTDMEDLYDELSEQVDLIDQDLSDVEAELYEDFDDDFDDDYDDFDDFDDLDDDENPFYEVTCGSCGEKINVSEDVLLEGEIECPNCGELLEFDFSGLFEDEELIDCDADCKTCGACDFDKDEDKDKDKDKDKDTTE